MSDLPPLRPPPVLANEALKPGLANVRGRAPPTRAPPFGKIFHGSDLWAKLTVDPTTRGTYSGRTSRWSRTTDLQGSRGRDHPPPLPSRPSASACGSFPTTSSPAPTPSVSPASPNHLRGGHPVFLQARHLIHDVTAPLTSSPATAPSTSLISPV